MLRTKRALMLMLLLLATACSPAPESARHTVEEYRANAELRRAQVTRCQSDPGSLKKTPDCINAQQAAAFEDRIRLRDMPPLGLDSKHDSPSERSQSQAPGADEPTTQPPPDGTR